jgi:hypothetical protein
MSDRPNFADSAGTSAQVVDDETVQGICQTIFDIRQSTFDEPELGVHQIPLRRPPGIRLAEEDEAKKAAAEAEAMLGEAKKAAAEAEAMLGTQQKALVDIPQMKTDDLQGQESVSPPPSVGEIGVAPLGKRFKLFSFRRNPIGNRDSTFHDWKRAKTRCGSSSCFDDKSDLSTSAGFSTPQNTTDSSASSDDGSNTNKSRKSSEKSSEPGDLSSAELSPPPSVAQIPAMAFAKAPRRTFGTPAPRPFRTLCELDPTSGVDVAAAAA